MLKTTTIPTLLFFATIIFIFTNCASLTGFQTGRTVGEGNGEIMATINVSQTPEFDLDSNDTSEVDNLFFPNIEIGGRFGLTEKMDLGIKANTTLNVAFDLKYQLVGDQESDVAVAAGFGFGSFAAFAGLWNLQVPLYFSFHPTESLGIYISPRYIAQFAAGDISGHLNYLGGNAGVLFGKRTKFGLDAGIYNISTSGVQEVLPIVTFGVGVKVPIGY